MTSTHRVCPLVAPCTRSRPRLTTPSSCTEASGPTKWASTNPEAAVSLAVKVFQAFLNTLFLLVNNGIPWSVNSEQQAVATDNFFATGECPTFSLLQRQLLNHIKSIKDLVVSNDQSLWKHAVMRRMVYSKP